MAINKTRRQTHDVGIYSNRSVVVVFMMGFMTRHIIGYLFSGHPVNNINTSIEAGLGIPHNNANKDCPSMQGGIYPLMRDFQCGHVNMETPRVLRKTAGAGRGRYVVDVGLHDGEETLDAVEAGFVVFGFEMMPGLIEDSQNAIFLASSQFQS